jgi:GPH family glycoside/pentoside/hexuronide:cation symporter
VKFPVGAQTSVIDHVDPAIMRNMVMLWLPTTMALNLTAVALLLLYRLDRSSHEANLEALSRAASLMAAPSSLPTGVTPVPDPGAASPLV